MRKENTFIVRPRTKRFKISTLRLFYLLNIFGFMAAVSPGVSADITSQNNANDGSVTIVTTSSKQSPNTGQVDLQKTKKASGDAEVKPTFPVVNNHFFINCGLEAFNPYVIFNSQVQSSTRFHLVLGATYEDRKAWNRPVAEEKDKSEFTDAVGFGDLEAGFGFEGLEIQNYAPSVGWKSYESGSSIYGTGVVYGEINFSWFDIYQRYVPNAKIKGSFNLENVVGMTANGNFLHLYAGSGPAVALSIPKGNSERFIHMLLGFYFGYFDSPNFNSDGSVANTSISPAFKDEGGILTRLTFEVPCDEAFLTLEARFQDSFDNIGNWPGPTTLTPWMVKLGMSLPL